MEKRQLMFVKLLRQNWSLYVIVLCAITILILHTLNLLKDITLLSSLTLLLLCTLALHDSIIKQKVGNNIEEIKNLITSGTEFQVSDNRGEFYELMSERVRTTKKCLDIANFVPVPPPLFPERKQKVQLPDHRGYQHR